MDCNSCKEKRQNVEPIPYIAHEAEMARLEREHSKEREHQALTIKRLWILLIIVISLLVVTNGAWIWYESQWEVVESTEITQEVEAGMGDAVVSGIGDIIYGESEADS